MKTRCSIGKPLIERCRHHSEVCGASAIAAERAPSPWRPHRRGDPSPWRPVAGLHWKTRRCQWRTTKMKRRKTCPHLFLIVPVHTLETPFLSLRTTFAKSHFTGLPGTTKDRLGLVETPLLRVQRIGRGEGRHYRHTSPVLYWNRVRGSNTLHIFSYSFISLDPF